MRGQLAVGIPYLRDILRFMFMVLLCASVCTLPVSLYVIRLGESNIRFISSLLMLKDSPIPFPLRVTPFT